jgi:hypothetical protein
MDKVLYLLPNDSDFENTKGFYGIFIIPSLEDTYKISLINKGVLEEIDIHLNIPFYSCYINNNKINFKFKETQLKYIGNNEHLKNKKFYELIPMSINELEKLAKDNIYFV